MTRDEDGRPKVGETARTLGARPYAWDEPQRDIPVVAGSVRPGTGGMSVAPTLEDLPIYRIPKRYDVPGRGYAGSGKVEDSCWIMGDGPFEIASVSDGLRLVPDSRTHGTVQPSLTMSWVDYQGFLAATRLSWAEIPAARASQC
jgi:hypothetical protein